MQARSAAAAYEQAYAMTVPPPAITANRTQLTSLVATNILGQNTAAIADTEAQYAEYWAQDATAMTGYATSSGAATQLPRFSAANKSTSESGLTAQNASVTQAVNSAITSNPVSQLITATPNQSVLATATSSSFIPIDLDILDVIQGTGQTMNSVYYMEAFASGVIGAENNLGVLPKVAAVPAALAPALTAAPPLSGAAGLGNITATLARADNIGPMSMPASWSAPSSSQVAAWRPTAMTTLPGTDEALASGYPGYPGMPGGGASRSTGAGVPPRYGVRLTVMPRPPAAG